MPLAVVFALGLMSSIVALGAVTVVSADNAAHHSNGLACNGTLFGGYLAPVQTDEAARKA